MSLFREQRFVYMGGGTSSESASFGKERETKSPIDLKMEELMSRSGLVIEEAGRKAEVSNELSTRLGQHFKGVHVDLNSPSDVGGLKNGLVEALRKNLDALPELKGKEEQFVDQVIGIFTSKIIEMVDKNYPELKGQNLPGLLVLSFAIDDSGQMEVFLKPDKDLFVALDAAQKAVKDSEVAVASGEPASDVAKPAEDAAKPAEDAAKPVEDAAKPVDGAQSVEVAADTKLADTILASAVLNGTAIATTYGGLRDTLLNSVKASEKELLANADYTKIKAANNDLRREAFVELLLSKTAEAFGGLLYLEDGDKKTYYSPDVLSKVNGAFLFKISAGKISFDMSEAFKTEYEKVRLELDSKPKSNEVAAVAELKTGMSGWILKNVFGVKTDAGLVEIVRGNSPLSYFFGAVAVTSAGKSFGWATGFWDKGKEMMKQNPMTAKYVDVVEKAAKTFSGFTGKFSVDKVKSAVSKGVDDFIKMGTVVGDGLFKVAEDGKGIKLDGDLDLGEKTLRMIVGKDVKVIFPSNVSDVVKDGEKLTSPVTELADGMYELKNIPKNTYIPDGVSFKIV